MKNCDWSIFPMDERGGCLRRCLCEIAQLGRMYYPLVMEFGTGCCSAKAMENCLIDDCDRKGIVDSLKEIEATRAIVLKEVESLLVGKINDFNWIFKHCSAEDKSCGD